MMVISYGYIIRNIIHDVPCYITPKNAILPPLSPFPVSLQPPLRALPEDPVGHRGWEAEVAH